LPTENTRAGSRPSESVEIHLKEEVTVPTILSIVICGKLSVRRSCRSFTVLKKRALGTRSKEIKIETFMVIEIYLFTHHYSVISVYAW
jgi:hypothetical protein